MALYRRAKEISSKPTSIYPQDKLNSLNVKPQEVYLFDRFRLDALHLLLYENAQQQKAFELFTAQIQKEGGDKRVNGPLAVIYASSKRKSEVQKILAEMAEEEKQGKYVFSFGRAAIYAEMGDTEQAFRWLEKAYVEHFGGMTELKVAPAFDKIRNDPRFIDLLRRVGLPS